MFQPGQESHKSMLDSQLLSMTAYCSHTEKLKLFIANNNIAIVIELLGELIQRCAGEQ